MISEKIIFIDNTSYYTHNDIKNIAIGASEHQFYNLIYSISKEKKEKILCFNNILNDTNIDNIYYSNINNINNIELYQPSIIVIQRIFPINFTLKNKIINHKIYIWIHDLASPMIFLNNNENLINHYNNNQEEYKNEILKFYYDNKNINFIFNSSFCKDLFENYMKNFNIFIEENRLNTIYNILYEDDFNEVKNINILKDVNKIVYASAWQKGIEEVIKVFDYIIEHDNSIKLILLSPGYDLDKFIEYKTYLINKYPNNIIILGKLNKYDYANVIKSSLCVLSSTFSETFGCVFSESYYLGTPVIADIKSGAVKEIIDNNYILNYNNPCDVYLKIKELQQNSDNLNISLNEKFLLNHNLKNWIKMLEI